MKKAMRTRLAAFALVVVLAAPSAMAAVICVTPASVALCPHHTINAAISAVAPGDTIQVAPGTYYESSINVPPGLDGLTISGAGKAATILDIGNNTALAITGSSLMGFYIESRKVTVKNMTVRNGERGLITVAPGTTVTAMAFVGQEDTGVLVSARGAQVTLSEFRSMATAIQAGFGTIVKQNTIASTLIGVDAQDNTQVLLNTISNSSIAIQAKADGPLISSNDLRYQYVGIATLGASPTITFNKILGAVTGIDARCTSCFGGSISSNSVTDATVYGLLVSSDAPGLQVENNSVLRAGPVGIEILNSPGAGDRGVLLENNKVADAGHAEGSACYLLSGDGNVAVKNLATRCAGAGFWVVGNDNTLDGNVARDGFENGIKVDGGGVPYAFNYVTGNTSSGNTGDGIAIVGNASATTVQLNVSKLNRKHFCDNTLNATSFYGNSFAAPGAAVPCAIVH
jgi:hypothetical protein